MRRKLFHIVAAVSIVAAGMFSAVQAGVVSFGSGSNQFHMEFVTIGNPGNLADTDALAQPLNAGAVGYTYGIGKFEVSRDMIAKFNASQSLQISLADMSDNGGNGTNKPATGVSWNEAARFVNWLNTNTGNHVAYKFTTNGVNDDIALWVSGEAGYDSSNPYRNSLAKYVLPSSNEWYKAAYYNPNDSLYYDFPNGLNIAPTAVASSTADNTAVYFQTLEQGPADVDKAGGLSPYGVMGLGGNAWEWEESFHDVLNIGVFSHRGIRGGLWVNGSATLSSSIRARLVPSLENAFIGFRVASLSSSAPPTVPEPSMMVIGTLFGLGGLVAKRRMKK